MERTFLDTNVFVYADDLDAGSKRDVAQSVVSEALSSAAGVVSTQVLQEFYVVSTKKLGVSATTARRKVELVARLDVVPVRVELIVAAIDIQRLHNLSFWDALVIKAAAVSNCSRLLSEDLQHGQVIDGVRVENPFAAARP